MVRNLTYEELEQRVEELERESFERKRAEEKLRYQKRRLEALIEYSSLAIVTLDEGHNIISCNQDFEELFHFKESDIVGRNLDELIASHEYIEDAISYTKETLRGKAIHGSGKRQRKDGEYIDVEFIGVPIIIDGKLIGAYGIYQDISERKRAEEALKISRQRLTQIFDFLPDATFAIDKDGKVIAWNKAIEDMTGIKAEDIMGKGNYEYAIPFYGNKRPVLIDLVGKWNEEIKQKYQYVKKEDEFLFSETYDPLVKPGGFLWNKACRLYDSNGEVIGAIESIRDITETKRAEEALRKSEEHYRSIFEDSRDAIYITTRDGKFIDANQSALDLFGYSREEMESVNALQLYVHPGDADRFQGEIEKKGFLRDYEVTFRKKDGTELDCLLNTSLRRANDGSILGYQGIIRDMTEQRKLEAQFRQSQKMEAIGTLAGGVAHDFNNLLTTIIGNADLGLMDMGKDHPLRGSIEDIKKAANSAASLTRQLLAFSRKQVIKPEVLDLNEVITVTKKMLKRLMGEDVELSTVLEPEPWKVHADRGQVEQVIMNLTVNARDAMPQGGQLTVETANIDLDEDYFRKHGIEEQPGSYVMLSVNDTGIGMDKETQSHIFEPFFTSKGIGKGTGLGLSTVYGIVKQNNGFVWTYSEPGQGTTFKIYLPKAKKDVEPEKKGRTPVIKLDGSETVLIVEDDDSLRKLAKRSLQPHGYRILAAENGEDALRVSKENEGPIDLLITDVVMPKMGGKEVAERLQPLYPNMKVIYMSGYTDGTIVNHGVLAPGLNFFEKPFSPEGLARKVREVLDKQIDA
jgi:two-component system, cell cycle sensor histidine kinase and response regulator CckA